MVDWAYAKCITLLKYSIKQPLKKGESWLHYFTCNFA